MSKILHSLLVFLILSILVLPSASAQECGCTNCPLQITDNGSFDAFIDVSIDGPNDLGQCQLEQVCFTITHTWVGDLAASLISPSGLNYLIMADNNNTFGGCGLNSDNIDVCITVGTGNPLTNNTAYACNNGNPCLQGNWTVPCGGVTAPFSGGVQAPGCDLDAFNVPGDPVNGTWTLRIIDICGQDEGPLEDWSLVFSCPTLSCISCEAEGGNLPGAPIVVCGGDAGLNLPPSGHQTAPEYGYTYIISENDIVIDVNDGPDLTGLPFGDYEVCGFSYDLAAQGELFLFIGESLSSLQADFDSNPPFCADFSNNCVDVSLGEPPFVEIDGPLAACGEEEVNLFLIGGPFNTITWSTNETTDNINVDPGTYSVTVTDDTGCESTAEYTVDELPAPEPEIIGPDEICDGDEALLELSEVYAAYEWSTNEFTPEILVTEGGGYEVTVTDFDGCTGTAVFTLNIQPPIDVSISGDPSYCEGDGTILAATPGFVSYEWSNGETFSDIFVSEPGIISVTVTNGLGCEGEVEIEVFENPLPEPTIDGPEAVCPGETISLEVLENFQSYEWSTSFTTQTTPVDAPGLYTVTVTDSNGCEGETDFEVIAGEGVIADVQGDLFFCPDGSTELTITPGYDSYEWSNGLSGDENTIDVEGDYLVTVTSVDGCEQILDFSVFELAPPEPEITGDFAICEGETTDLVVDGIYVTYEWSNSETDFEITVDETDTYTVTVTDDNGCEGEASVDVVVNTPVDLEIAGPDELCANAVGTLSITGSFMDVQWIDGPPNTNVYSIVGPGTYEVEVIDMNGCEAFASFTVEQGEADPIEITGDAQICSDGDGMLTATGGFTSYSWSNSQTTQSITVTNPGIYFVIGTDADGCESLAEFTVGEVQAPSPTISGDLTICPDGSTTLSTDAGFANYNWNIGGSGNQVNVANPGTVMVTVTDAFGCTGSTSAVVQEVPDPTPQILGDFILCEDEVSTLSLDQPYATYQWSTSSTDPTIDVSDEMTVSVTVTDAEGCSGSTSVMLDEIIPTVDISGDLDFCLGETTMLTVPDNFSAYAWSTGGTTNEITISGNTDVQVTVTDANGCTATDVVSLTEYALPDVDIDGRLSFCPAGGTELTATPGYVNYAWNTTESTSTIFLNQAGSYTVTVTDSNGCQNSTSVNVIEDAELDPVIEGIPSFCAGLNTELMVDDIYATYSWSNSAATNLVTITQAGSYTVTVSDEFGCMGTATVDVEALPLPEPMISGDLDYCIGDSTTLNGGNGYATYQWSVAGQDQQFLVATTPGQYSVTVTDDNGCVGSTDATVVENALPVTAIQGEAGFCPGLTTILTAEDGFVAYNWSTGGSGTSIEVGTEETFSLSVTDANGCVGVADLPVVEYVTAIPAINGPQQFCPGENTTLAGEAGFVTYNWSNGSTDPSVLIDMVGTVDLIVSDNNGCITSNSVDLSNFIVTPPTITAVDGFCTGNTADLVATPGYTSYTWSNTEQTSTITVSDGGVYEVDVIDTNGCPSDAVISIEEYALPEPLIGGSLTFCIGNSTTLNAGAQYMNYQWSTGGDQQEVIINTPGNVGLTVTDANGCVGSTAEFVNEATELSPVITGDLDYCFGLSTMLDAGNGFATYNWSTGETTSTITVMMPGTYTLDVTDDSGCAGTAMVEVIENPLPTPSITGDFDYCAGLSTDIAANPGYVSYEWSTGAPTETITVGTPGIYLVEVVDVNGCINSTSVEVIEQSLPVFDIVGPTDFCVDSFTLLQVTPAYAEYSWSVGGTDQSVQVSTGGVVGVTVTDANGCVSSGAQEVATVALPLADAGAPQSLDCEILSIGIGGNGSSSGANFTYQWTGPGITGANGTLENPIVDEEGMYTLVVTNEEFGCVSAPAEVVVTDLAYTPQVILEVLDVLDCATQTVQIDARDSDGGPEFVYQWLDGNLNPIPDGNALILNVNEAQFYTLQVLDTITGCGNSGMVEVEENELYPIAEAGLDQLLTCGSPVVTLDGTGSQMGGQISYIWTTPNGAFIGNTNNNTASVNEPGWYFLLVTDEFNGCANQDSVFVDQNVVPPVAFTSDDFELDCNFPSTILSGAGSSVGATIAYQWLLNGVALADANTLAYTAEAPGTYTLVVTDTENECTAQDITLISLNPAAPQALDFFTDTPTCAGDDDGGLFISGVQGGTPPYMYSVGGAPYTETTNYSNLVAGDYDIIVEDATGCLLLTTITVPDGNDLQLELGPDQYLNEGELADIFPQITVDSASLVAIDWQTVFRLPCDNCVVQRDLALKESTQFFLKIRDENGCTAEDRLTIFINKDRNIYVPSAFSPNGDGDNDFFYIFSDDSVEEIKSFLVFNRWGESVFEVYGSQPNDPRWGWDGTYRGEPVNSAVYVWMAEVEFKNGDVEIIKGDVVIMR